MSPPSLDQDYAYYDTNNNGRGNTTSAAEVGAAGMAADRGGQRQDPPPTSQQSRVVRKGLGARPMMQQQEHQSHQPHQQQQQQQLVDSRDATAAVVSPVPPPVNHTVHYNDNQDHDHQNNGGGGGAAEGADDALLDLEQLEELQHEAERMKALGNKHMAAQEYTRAYNAYSAALQLSPVGPSSHVFLSNRSAALLSLKRYTAAATDARRAIALAPTFGKAHARLGQSLYFLKDYEGAIVAYEDAIHYEPDNDITKTYLEKARAKLQRQQEKVQRQQQNGNSSSSHTRGEDHTVITTESSMQHTVVNSVVTDPDGSNAVVQSAGFRAQSNAMVNAVGGAFGSNKATGGGAAAAAAGASVAAAAPMATLDEATLDEHLAEGKNGDDEDQYQDQDDPDFEEALRIQERANQYLANKNYKYAIEEYTAALFLVPDDENLSPELHLGRAHALNGSRRHESAKIDSQLAIKIKPTPEAYSTLAKSLFYMRDYPGAIEAFKQCKESLPDGEELSMFDRAYLQKAEAALQDELHEGRFKDPKLLNRSKISATPVPKLKPPKFVSREEAMNRTLNVPAMPDNWPQQSPRDSKGVKFGEEREVTFLSEALGIKLNRGPDGIVRVIEVSPDIPGSPIAREGKIEVGDVVREAAGVDIRRPLTNVMWGDTVALLKMAPRPIVLVVAKEESRSAMYNQRMQAAQNALSPTSASQAFPSNSSTEESVRDQMERQNQQQQQQQQQQHDQVEEGEENGQQSENRQSPSPPNLDHVTQVDSSAGNSEVDNEPATEADEKTTAMKEKGEVVDESASVTVVDDENQPAATAPLAKSLLDEEEAEGEDRGAITSLEKKTVQDEHHDDTESTKVIQSPVLDSREEEARMLGGEIMFERKDDARYGGWDNLRWMAYSGDRKIVACEPAYRYFEDDRKSWFSGSGEQYCPRKIALYETPQLILILRQAKDATEFRELMDVPKDAGVSEEDMKYNLFVESVIDPKLCKLRLSQLTTVTSVVPSNSERRKSCFALINPVEEIILSAVRLRNGMTDANFSDSGAFLEVSGLEHTLSTYICRAHHPSAAEEHPEDLSWKHQIILGTLHSYVVTGSTGLEAAIQGALAHERARDSTNPSYLNSRVIDAQDESGKTALHYACVSRSSQAVTSLVKAGANVDIRFEPHDMTPCHRCAKHLDFKSLRSILAVNRRANVLDSLGRTPIYLAIASGRTVGNMFDPDALNQCLIVMEDYGGEVGHLTGYIHPVSLLASNWQFAELSVVLLHCHFRYPLRTLNKEDEGISTSAFFHYPIHCALITLRRIIQNATKGGDIANKSLWDDCARADSDLSKTLKTLLGCGFEANERLESVSGHFPEKDSLVQHVGFAPIQIIAAAALEASRQKESLGETLHTAVVDLLTKLSVILVRHGARLSLGAPPLERRNISDDSQRLEVDSLSPITVDRSALKIQGNNDLTIISIFGTPKIDDALKYWKNLKPAVVVSGKVVLYTDNKIPIEDSLAPGGSDEKTCAVCWTPFGMMVRKHRCRISRRYVCDACSSHRISEGEEEHRVTDGQFVLAKGDEIIEMNENTQMAIAMVKVTQEQQKQEARSPKSYKAAGVRQQRMEQEEAANRDSLFGGLIASVTKTLTGSSDSKNDQDASANNADSISGLNAQLNETRDKLNERGEKLSGLADKSDQLVQASQDFAAMAKELNRKSSQGFFSSIGL